MKKPKTQKYIAPAYDDSGGCCFWEEKSREWQTSLRVSVLRGFSYILGMLESKPFHSEHHTLLTSVIKPRADPNSVLRALLDWKRYDAVLDEYCIAPNICGLMLHHTSGSHRRQIAAGCLTVNLPVQNHVRQQKSMMGGW